MTSSPNKLGGFDRDSSCYPRVPWRFPLPRPDSPPLAVRWRSDLHGRRFPGAPGHCAKRAGEDVPRRVQVSVEARAAWTRVRAVLERERRVGETTALRADLRGPLRRHLDIPTRAIPLLVLAEPAQEAPTRVGGGLGESPLHVPTQVHVLEGEEIVGLHPPGRDLVREVPPLAPHPCMTPRHPNPLLLPVVGALTLPRELPLLALQPDFGVAEKLRRFDRLPRREDGEVGETEVHAHGDSGGAEGGGTGSGSSTVRIANQRSPSRSMVHVLMRLSGGVRCTSTGTSPTLESRRR